MSEETHIFTFGVGQALAGRYVELKGTCNETRMEMLRLFGDKWSFQYTREEGLRLADDYGYEQLAVFSELSTLKWGE